MTLKLYAMTCGWLTMPMGSLLEGEQGTLRVPVPAYVIEHPKGRVLFDSGLHIATQTDPHKRIGENLRHIGVHFAPGEEVSRRLEALDCGADGIDYLVNSHLHFDHTGGNAQLPNATLVLQKREWEAGHDADLMQRNGYKSHDYDHGHKLKLVDGEHDLFGDGSVSLIPTYGHTPGHQSMRLKLGGRDVILAADSCYLRRSLETLHIPRVHFDRDATLQSLKTLKRLQDGGAKIFYGHDPEFWSDIPQAPLRVA